MYVVMIFCHIWGIIRYKLNDDALFNSFKVDIKMSDMAEVLDADFWPIGIHVRRFYKPKTYNS